MNKYKEIWTTIEDGKNITLLTHAGPDGDAIGSLMGMYYILRENFSEKNITPVCRDKIPEQFLFLDEGKKITNTPPKKTDILICVDMHDISRSNFTWEDFWNIKKSINIDHHIGNTNFADINLVEDTPCAAVIVFESMKNFSKISWKAATALLTGVYTDTGSFQYLSNKTEIFSSTQDLVNAWGDIKKIMEHIFHANSLFFTKLIGKILSKIEIYNHIAFVLVSLKNIPEKIRERVKTSINTQISCIKEAKFTMVFFEKEEYIGTSLRCQSGKYDMNALAQALGGWWHKKAASFRLLGNIEEKNGEYIIVDNDKDTPIKKLISSLKYE